MTAALVALVAVPLCADEPDWVSPLLERIRTAEEGDAASYAAALMASSDGVRAHQGQRTPSDSKSALLAAIKLACRSEEPTVRYAAWHGAAAACAPEMLTCLTDAVENLAQEPDKQHAVHAFAGAVHSSGCAAAHVILLRAADQLWRHAPPASEARRAMRLAFESAARCTAAELPDAKPAAARTRLRRAIEGALESASDPVLKQDVLLALALVPTIETRDALKRWFKGDRLEQEDDLVLVIAGLGDAGDPDAVPFLLARVPDSSPAVLAASVRALHRLKAEAYRVHVRALGDTLAAGLGKEARFLAAIADSKRKEREVLQARAGALHGLGRDRSLHALFWKIVDANEDLFSDRRPPPPPRGLIKPSKPGAGNVVTMEDWRMWWKAARKYARRR